MGFRGVALLVMVYVALDFANPMMPGAVQLVGGSLETISGCQARNAEVLVLALTIVPRTVSTVVPQRDPTLPTGRVVSISPRAPILFRAPFESRSTPASSPEDD